MIRTTERHLSIRESSRPGLPGEPRYRFEIGDGERRLAELQDVLEEHTKGEIIL